MKITLKIGLYYYEFNENIWWILMKTKTNKAENKVSLMYRIRGTDNIKRANNNKATI